MLSHLDKLPKCNAVYHLRGCHARASLSMPAMDRHMRFIGQSLLLIFAACRITPMHAFAAAAGCAGFASGI